MVNIVRNDEWVPRGDVILDVGALEAIKDVNNSLVIAGPGAGKTELLTQKLDYLFSTNKCVSPKKILALSFKTDAASNLKERVKKRYGDEYASRFTSLTYAAFEKRILDQFREALPEHLRPSKDYLIEDWGIIKEILIKNRVQLNDKTDRDIKKEVEKIIFENGHNDKVKNELLKGTQDNKAVLLYPQITSLATSVIDCNQYIRKALQMTYEFIFLDEFQDTTFNQYKLLKTCFLNSSCKLTAVGDNKQAIMSWAGANPDIFKDYFRDFNLTVYQLLVNYRSVPKLVEFQKEVERILNDNKSFSQISNSQVSNSQDFDDGEIILYEFENDSIEAEKIAIDIESKIARGIRPPEICILVKQKVEYYSSKLISILNKKGIRARIENEYQEILKDPICNVILNLISYNKGERDPLIWESLRNFYANINGIDEYTDEFTLAKSDKEIDDINREITYLISNPILDENSMKNIIDNIIKKIDEKRIISTFPTYKGKIELDIIVEKFSKLLYREYLESEGLWSDIVSRFKGEKSIPIMTIHKSKGLEYEVVYFLGLEDSAFWNFKKQPEENKSVFYVALSRAKSSLIFTYCKNRNGRQEYNSSINEIYSLLIQSRLVDKYLLSEYIEKDSYK